LRITSPSVADAGVLSEAHQGRAGPGRGVGQVLLVDAEQGRGARSEVGQPQDQRRCRGRRRLLICWWTRLRASRRTTIRDLLHRGQVRNPEAAHRRDHLAGLASGWVDYYTYRLGERVKPRARPAVCGEPAAGRGLHDGPAPQELDQGDKIELVNFRDALYGTSEYQNHLKAVGSDLA